MKVHEMLYALASRSHKRGPSAYVAVRVFLLVAGFGAVLSAAQVATHPSLLGHCIDRTWIVAMAAGGILSIASSFRWSSILGSLAGSLIICASAFRALAYVAVDEAASGRIAGFAHWSWWTLVIFLVWPGVVMPVMRRGR
jgi:hypothetical protein